MQGATHEDYVRATMAVAKTRVLECSQLADAACPVYLRAGDHLSSCGQSADYRHAITADAARSHGAGAVVTSYWDGSRLSVSIEGVDREIDRTAVDAEVARTLRRRREQADREREAEVGRQHAEMGRRERAACRDDAWAAHLAYRHLGIDPVSCTVRTWGDTRDVHVPGRGVVTVRPDGTCTGGRTRS